MAWHKICSFDALTEGAVLGADVDGIPVALYRLDEKVFATHGICTHALAHLSQGWVEDGKIECPLHQGVFDIRTGKALCSPVTQDVRTYPVKRDGDDIYIDITGQAGASGSAAEIELEANAATVPKRVVVVGAGQAAAAAIHALHGAGFVGSTVLVGEEVHLPYERPPLSKDFLLTSSKRASFHRLTEEDASAFGVHLHLGVKADSIDAERKQISLGNGKTLMYDALLLTCGGRARRLPVPGANLPGVHYLRTIEDAVAIERAFTSAKQIVIVGGGFLGLELASSAVARGIRTTILEREPEVMARLLPSELGFVFRELAKCNGVDVRCSAGVNAIASNGGQLSVTSGDEVFDADAVLVAVGLDPELALAKQAGCVCDTGIVVDADGRTSVTDIWAAGDCASHHEVVAGRRMRLESWHNAEEQGTAAGCSIAGAPSLERKRQWFWTDQFGLNIQMLGIAQVTDVVAFCGNNPAAAGAVYRTIDRATRRLTSVIAFSDPQAIRKGRIELDAAGVFDIEASGARPFSPQDIEGSHPEYVASIAPKDLADTIATVACFANDLLDCRAILGERQDGGNRLLTSQVTLVLQSFRAGQ